MLGRKTNTVLPRQSYLKGQIVRFKALVGRPSRNLSGRQFRGERRGRILSSSGKNRTPALTNALSYCGDVFWRGVPTARFKNL